MQHNTQFFSRLRHQIRVMNICLASPTEDKTVNVPTYTCIITKT